MRNTRIYLNQSLDLNTKIELDRQAAHHLTRVLRLRNNDSFTIFNGLSGDYKAQLNIDNKKYFANILEHINPLTSPSISINLLQCISKGDRMDFAIQKATELNVSTIIPVISEHMAFSLKDDRWEKKLTHWRAVAISACEQCGRNDIPDIMHPVDFEQLLSNNMDGTKLILDPLADNQLSSIKSDTDNFYLLIGPEGGLSGIEVTRAKQNGFSGIKLGQRILRTETAAIAGIAAIQTLWGDFMS
ncbi:MAG: 16S rRNA (uracil(1498)-N(3))-methyltransferase [Gammaproteobacteria bacterium]|nr:16S rRNA (uracil(1498)-N(3))-methyltransferase [Gammaproteobacteria bacterium]MCW9056583.1 16S rRNA (uracil(1498)-N(3))-methyltransferase [Gammaproteobacteria bacterium]